ncbi:hypothetical protein CVT26_015857 [Gymnopilus dilepis]|uniref:Uncharacterized protein n=1 Tax=Gymnopilus dilepis TaxID=231916 RepID=A0A409XYB1_9AGAR|nr:hypothetical protein CVT26_015857 [Gymnopilus dilepis]
MAKDYNAILSCPEKRTRPERERDDVDRSEKDAKMWEEVKGRGSGLRLDWKGLGGWDGMGWDGMDTISTGSQISWLPTCNE